MRSALEPALHIEREGMGGPTVGHVSCTPSHLRFLMYKMGKNRAVYQFPMVSIRVETNMNDLRVRGVVGGWEVSGDVCQGSPRLRP